MDFLINKLLIIPGILVGFAFHEFAHAKTAELLGDDTARRLGRVTVDPAAHIDVLGFLMLLVAGFGWGKPVPVNENNFKKPGRDNMLVSFAGPFMNLIVAAVFLLVIKIMLIFQFGFLYTQVGQIILDILDYAVWINLVLMVFNLIPVPPLDGYHILSGLLDFRGKGFHYQLYDKGRIILLILIVTRATRYILLPPVNFIYNGLVQIFF
ncbi:MAG: site-2 protease family protein [Clostridia bacterium]|nr:site-2 protease family protein [Clostridia bacterium]